MRSHHQQPDHTATPNTCTKHRHHPRLLDALSPQINRQLALRLSTTQTFKTQQRLHRRDTTTAIFTPMHLWCKFRLIKPEFKLIHLSLSCVQSSVNHTNCSRNRHSHTSPATGVCSSLNGIFRLIRIPYLLV